MYYKSCIRLCAFVLVITVVYGAPRNFSTPRPFQYDKSWDLSGEDWIDMAIKYFPTTTSTTAEGLIEEVEDGLAELENAGESAYEGFYWLISHIGINILYFVGFLLIGIVCCLCIAYFKSKGFLRDVRHNVQAEVMELRQLNRNAGTSTS